MTKILEYAIEIMQDFKFEFKYDEEKIIFSMGLDDYVTDVHIVSTGNYFMIESKLNLGITEPPEVLKAIVACNVCNNAISIGSFYYSGEMQDLMYDYTMFVSNSEISYADLKETIALCLELIEILNDKIAYFAKEDLDLEEFSKYVSEVISA